jgi:hypothetical protein
MKLTDGAMRARVIGMKSSVFNRSSVGGGKHGAPGAASRGGRSASWRRQAGSLMIEVSLALLISAIAGVGAMREAARAELLRSADIEADSLLMYRTALQNYVDEFYAELQSGLAISKAGVNLASGTAPGQTYQPLVQNLIDMGYLSPGFSNSTILIDGGQFRSTIERLPSGCVSVACNVEGLAYIDRPFYVRGTTETNGPVIGQMLSRIGGFAGTSVDGVPANITGAGAAWSRPNPVAGTPAGVVAARFGFAASALSSFVRIGDTRDPNLAGPLTVAGNTQLNGTLGVAGTSTFGGASTFNGTTTLNGAATVNNNTLTVANGGTACVTVAPTGVVTINCTGRLNATTGVFTSGAETVTIDPASGVVATQRVRGSRGLGTNSATLFDAVDPNAITVTAGQMFIRGSSGTLVTFDNGDVVASRNASSLRMTLRESVSDGAACGPTTGAIGTGEEFATLSGGGLAVCRGGRWTALMRVAAHQSPCSVPGANATDSASGEGLICKGGVYSRQSEFLSSFALKSTTSVGDGSILVKPSCASTGPTAPVAILFLMPANEASTDAAFLRGADDLGGSWRVRLQSGDGSSSPGNAIAMAYCWYPNT